MNKEINKKIEELLDTIPGEAEIEWTTDLNGNAYCWCELAQVDDLVHLAKGLLPIGGRLVTLTGHAPQSPMDKGFFQVCYHFIISGTSLNITVVPEGAEPTVPSITEWHKAADWAEREVAETYQITIANHPNPRPLFLSAETQPEAMERMVPLSTMTNGASTSTLWEKIMGEDSGEVIH